MAIEETLKANGWCHWHSETHWVHPDIFYFLEKLKILYWRADYTNYQYSTDDAFEIYKKCQESNQSGGEGR